MSTLEDIQRQLPSLPGNSVETNFAGYQAPKPRKESYAKSHIFDVKNGIPVTMDLKFNEPSQHEIDFAQPPKFDGHKSDSYTRLRKEPRKNTEIDVRIKPRWLAKRNQVLRFWAYFEESVENSPIEKQIVRRITLYYYLEDGTIHIAESQSENSGLHQGCFLARRTVPYQDPRDPLAKSTRDITSGDFKLGTVLYIFNRPIKLCSCDKFTQSFYAEQNIDLGNEIQIPQSEFDAKQAKAKERKPSTTVKISQYVEGTLGKTMSWDLQKVRQYLHKEGQVLRFYCDWKDPHLYGEERQFVLHYFLADDSIEILEKYKPNAGKKLFPALLGRQKLPKKVQSSNSNTIGRDPFDKQEFYTQHDLRIGTTISVYKRDFLITAADPYTVEYYVQSLGRDRNEFRPLVKVAKESNKKREIQIPPPTGYGTDEDSLQSCFSLIAKPPRMNFSKWEKFEKSVLTFVARFDDGKPENKDRRFVLSFFMADDSIKIFEQGVRNSGFPAGKFLERIKLKDPKSKKPYNPKIFLVGTTVSINNFSFYLIHCDAGTLDVMINNPDIFPHSQPSMIAKKLHGIDVHQLSIEEFQKKTSNVLSLHEQAVLIHKYGKSGKLIF